MNEYFIFSFLEQLANRIIASIDKVFEIFKVIKFITAFGKIAHNGLQLGVSAVCTKLIRITKL